MTGVVPLLVSQVVGRVLTHRQKPVAPPGDRVALEDKLEGRVTVLDDSFKVLAHLGDNPDKSQWANNGVPPTAWKPGIFTAPHGVCFDTNGNLYVMDWNANGRISKLNRVETAVPTQPE